MVWCIWCDSDQYDWTRMENLIAQTNSVGVAIKTFYCNWLLHCYKHAPLQTHSYISEGVSMKPLTISDCFGCWIGAFRLLLSLIYHLDAPPPLFPRLVICQAFGRGSCKDVIYMKIRGWKVRMTEADCYSSEIGFLGGDLQSLHGRNRTATFISVWSFSQCLAFSADTE